MAILTISLPDRLKAYLDEQVQKGDSKSVNDFIASLVGAAARKQQAEKKLVQLVQEAEASGSATPWTPQKMETIRREGLKRLAAEKRKNAKNRPKARSRS